MIDEQKIIDEIIDDLTSEIRTEQNVILNKIGQIVGQSNYSFQQFNGRFGGKNNTFVDSVRTQFLDFNDFYSQWIKGLIDKYEEDRSYQINTYGKIYTEKASFITLKLIRDKEIESFVRKFLERNFYKKLNERTRLKPDEKLWSLWFGYKLTYGLIIAPVKREGIWTNDKSEIRKVDYNYWTIGHILKEGLIDPSLDVPLKFNSANDFINFYHSVLKRISNSYYEQLFCDKYVEFLKNSKNIESELFLIPELRYGGIIKDHEHRLDFTILNPYTAESTGIEISPASSHMKVANLKEKQYKVNEELEKKWNKEMRKRNDYFKDYGITTITFTDSLLKNIDNCFEIVREKLEMRPRDKVSIRSQIDRLHRIE